MNPTSEDILVLGILKERQVWLRGETEDGVSFGGRLQSFGTLPFLPSWGFVCTVNRTPGMKIKLDTLGVQQDDGLVVPVADWILNNVL